MWIKHGIFRPGCDVNQHWGPGNRYKTADNNTPLSWEDHVRCIAASHEGKDRGNHQLPPPDAQPV